MSYKATRLCDAIALSVLFINAFPVTPLDLSRSVTCFSPPSAKSTRKLRRFTSWPLRLRSHSMQSRQRNIHRTHILLVFPCLDPSWVYRQAWLSGIAGCGSYRKFDTGPTSAKMSFSIFRHIVWNIAHYLTNHLLNASILRTYQRHCAPSAAHGTLVDMKYVDSCGCCESWSDVWVVGGSGFDIHTLSGKPIYLALVDQCHYCKTFWVWLTYDHPSISLKQGIFVFRTMHCENQYLSIMQYDLIQVTCQSH